MINSNRVEKIILAFLIAALVSSIAVSAYKKTRSPCPVKVGTFDADALKRPESLSYSACTKININYAGAEDLMKIKGIGKNTARRIVDYRLQNGNFASIDDLKNVKGVSVGLFEKIRSKITVDN